MMHIDDGPQLAAYFPAVCLRTDHAGRTRERRPQARGRPGCTRLLDEAIWRIRGVQSTESESVPHGQLESVVKQNKKIKVAMGIRKYIGIAMECGLLEGEHGNQTATEGLLTTPS
jgi:hypothetical protein